jgi:hypothetical protein
MRSPQMNFSLELYYFIKKDALFLKNIYSFLFIALAFYRQTRFLGYQLCTGNYIMLFLQTPGNYFANC